MLTIFVIGLITMFVVSFWKNTEPIVRMAHVKMVVKNCSSAF